MAHLRYRHPRLRGVGLGGKHVRPIHDADVGELPGNAHPVLAVRRQQFANRDATRRDQRAAVEQPHRVEHPLALPVPHRARLVGFALPHGPVRAEAAADRKHLLQEEAVLPPANRRAAAHLLGRVAD